MAYVNMVAEAHGAVDLAGRRIGQFGTAARRERRGIDCTDELRHGSHACTPFGWRHAATERSEAELRPERAFLFAGRLPGATIAG